MKIGIDASRAFAAQRTGIEEYAYQVIKHLQDKLKGHEVILYVRGGDQCSFSLRRTKKRWNNLEARE